MLNLPFKEDKVFTLLALVVFLVPISFSIFTFEVFESVKFSLFLSLTALAGTIFFFEEQPLKTHKKLGYIVTAFLSLLFLSAVFAPDLFYSFFGFYYRYTSSFLFFVLLCLFGFLLIQVLSKDKFILLLKILVFDALLVAAVSLAQGYGYIFYGGIGELGFYRGPSLLGNPNFSSMFLSFMAPISLYFALFSTTNRLKLYFSLTTFVVVLSVFLLGSRGGILALFASFISLPIIFLLLKQSKKTLAVITFISIFILAISFTFISEVRPQAFSGIFNGTDTNVSSRFYGWQIAKDAILAHPFFGVGLGNYSLYFESIRSTYKPFNTDVFDDAHNLWLHLPATFGIPAFLLFLYICFFAVRVYIKKIINEKDVQSVFLSTALISFTVFVSFNPVPVPIYLVFVLILAGGLFESFIIPDLGFTLHRYIKYSLIFLLSCLSFFGICSFVSEHFLGLAKISLQANDMKAVKKYAKLAFVFNPTNGQGFFYKTQASISLKEDTEQVLKNIKKIENYHPSQAQSYVMSSQLYFQLFMRLREIKYLEFAIKALEKSVSIDKNFPARYGSLGLYYFVLGDYKLAKYNTLKALSLDKDLFTSWILYAKISQMENQKKSMLYALNNAYRLNPQIKQLQGLITNIKSTDDIQKYPLEIFQK